MNDNTHSLIRQAVLKQGFALEWQTSSIFRKQNYKVTPNELFSPFDWNKTHLLNEVEIDVVATLFQIPERIQQNYLVQCKGAASNNSLVLIESPHGSKKLRTLQFDKGNVSFSAGNFLANRMDGPFCAYTGDFFERKDLKGTERWEQCSKQDDKSNFYKGILQTVAGVDAVYGKICNESDKLKDYPHVIYPLIVTNAQVLIVRFEDQKNSINLIEPDIQEVPWVVYENSVGYGRSSNLDYADWPGVKKIPFIWVVNINYLERFITDPGYYSYKGVL